MDWILKLLRKRPGITAFLIYALIIISADFFGYFSYENQSKLYMLAENNNIVSIEGKVLSEPYVFKNRKRFLLETYNVNGNIISEKIIVNSPGGVFRILRRYIKYRRQAKKTRIIFGV
jgi:hypothetical protein